MKTEQLIQIFSKERSERVEPEELFFLRVLAVLVRTVKMRTRGATIVRVNLPFLLVFSLALAF